MSLSGPMFEPSENGVFKSLTGKNGAHYNLYSVREENGMTALRQMFPEGEANELNFCLFSTSGIHGMYTTIEAVEGDMDKPDEDRLTAVTFLIVHPRIVCMRYGNCIPENAEDIAFLKKLRASSWKAVLTIGGQGEDE